MGLEFRPVIRRRRRRQAGRQERRKHHTNINTASININAEHGLQPALLEKIIGASSPKLPDFLLRGKDYEESFFY